MLLRAQFTQLQPIRQLERRLVLESTRKPNGMSAVRFEVLRYAIGLARLTELRAGSGEVDVFEAVAPFRHWLVEQLTYLADPDGASAIDWRGLDRLVPSVATRVSEVRTHLLNHWANVIEPDVLEREVTQKKLVLVLGGGGGSGYAHLGTFAVLAELGLTPGMIVGSSMGALLGLFRAQSHQYDPMAIALALPRPSEVGRVFAPYRGYSRFGFPGTLELKARTIGTEIFKNLVGRDIPTIDELAIPYRAMVTGLRTGIGLALSDVEREIARASGRASPLMARRRLQLFTGVLRAMMSNPRFLKPLVFGSEPGLEDFSSVDAMGFSCAVPGIIHYDLYGENDRSAATMRELFSQKQLFRVTDGGISSNVACKAAWECVQRGEIESRNAFILAFDSFAPMVNLNSLFLPFQQIVRRTVLSERPYSDHSIAYRLPPSPVKLLQSFESLQQVIARTRSQLKSERPFIEAMMRPVPRWYLLDSRFNE